MPICKVCKEEYSIYGSWNKKNPICDSCFVDLYYDVEKMEWKENISW